ncbi:MAG: hypothetical protein AAGJ31_14495, partial [Verrucomicrobiota bacterium]
MSRSLLVLIVVLVMPILASAKFSLLEAEASGIPSPWEVTITSPFERVPHFGYLPVTVRYENRSPRPLRWDLQFRAGNGLGTGNGEWTSEFLVSAPPQSTGVEQLLIPLPPQLARGRSNSVDVTLVRGSFRRSGYHSNHAHNSFPTLAITEPLLLGREDELSEALDNEFATIRGSTPVSIPCDPSSFSPDPLAFSGIDVLLLTSKEWTDLPEPVKTGLLRWVQEGRDLLFADSLPSSVPPRSSWGLGWIQSLASPAKNSLPIPKLVRHMQRTKTNTLEDLRESYHKSWELRDLLKPREFGSLFLYLTLLAYAVCIGPLNLFVWAPAGKRHRLFFTVPIISTLTSFLLAVLILFQDGLGGEGKRAGLLLLAAGPEERGALLIQEQLSRSGVLTNRSFPLSSTTSIYPGILLQTPWTFFDTSYGSTASFRFKEGQTAGDHFRSRSEQAHRIVHRFPSRNRIELLPSDDDVPQLLSSLEVPIRDALYFAPDGRFWQASGLTSPGEPFALLEISEEE